MPECDFRLVEGGDKSFVRAASVGLIEVKVNMAPSFNLLALLLTHTLIT